MKLRHEYKHQINLSDIYELRPRLSVVLKRDINATDNGTYLVKSLYFDNYMDKALREKTDGVRVREKFRIRYYNTDTSYIRLEKKSKIYGLCNKESVRITEEEVRKILDGDIDFLHTSENSLKQEFYVKMKNQCLRPKSIVLYTRESFVYPMGNVRVTLDFNISGSSNVREFLNPELKFLNLYHDAVLEVKWDEFLPDIIRDAVRIKGRRAASFSKYAAVRF